MIGTIQRRCNGSGHWEVEDHSDCERLPTFEAIFKLKSFAEKLGFNVSLSVILNF